jgi:hypothetical protein
VLTSITEGLWVAAAPLSYFGMRIGTRMSVVRLGDASGTRPPSALAVQAGDLWVHSPVPLTAELQAAVDALGTVRHIVAPNLYHHLSAGEWKAAYPAATLHGPARLSHKRKDLPLTAKLEEAAAAPWAAELVPVHIDGCMIDETVFVHRPSRSLISSDLTENFVTHPHWPTRLYLKASGTYGKPGWPAPLRVAYRDRAAARRSLDGLLGHDFDRIVIAHGDIIESGGRAALEQTFAFLR